MALRRLIASVRHPYTGCLGAPRHEMDRVGGTEVLPNNVPIDNEQVSTSTSVCTTLKSNGAEALPRGRRLIAPRECVIGRSEPVVVFDAQALLPYPAFVGARMADDRIGRHQPGASRSY
jgi:hypothetical protein